MSPGSRIAVPVGVPNLILLWALLYCVNLLFSLGPALGQQFAFLQDYEAQQIFFRIGGFSDVDLLHLLLSLLNVTALLLPPFFLVLGILSIPFLAWRGRSVVRRYRLQPCGETALASLAQIRDFILAIKPDCAVYANISRAGELAFAFPVSRRSCGITVFGGLIRLWITDPAQAKAILLHEVAHCVYGDCLVFGVGSTFDFLVRYYRVFILWIAFPLLLALNVFLAVLAGTSSHPMLDAYKLVGGVAVQILLYLGVFLINMMFPMVALWIVELNADHFARSYMQDSTPLASAVQRLSGGREDPGLAVLRRQAANPISGGMMRLLLLVVGFFCFIERNMCHPPQWLRLRCARATTGIISSLLPLGYLLPLGALFGVFVAVALLPQVAQHFAVDDVIAVCSTLGGLLTALMCLVYLAYNFGKAAGMRRAAAGLYASVDSRWGLGLASLVCGLISLALLSRVLLPGG